VKDFVRRLLEKLLASQARRLRRRNKFSIIAVVGSIGKSSTKRAIAQYLAHAARVQYQEGNYNHPLTVPLVFFGRALPSLTNPFAWAVLLIKNEWQLWHPYPYDVVVLELGTDGPGQIQKFSEFLHVDVAVVSGIAPEHMEFFDSIDAVAAEELSIADFSDKVICNIDDIAPEYLGGLTAYVSYGLSERADYRLVSHSATSVTLHHERHKHTITTQLLGPHIQKVLAAAYACGDMLGLQPEKLADALGQIEPMAGRMQVLRGVKNSTIIDDTYNASPEAVKAALDVMYTLDAPQKIAVLGNMNELGDYSERAHQEIGTYCRSDHLDMVVVIGPDAERCLKPAAQANGVTVHAFATPFEVGDYLQDHIKLDGLVLCKGSQNGVYLEEAVKLILHNPEDITKLVRQSDEWLRRKEHSFRAA
jgi:UDP-N-acetylmuramoyl-tripeptide--D-alanyl-D-alanine ligase